MGAQDPHLGLVVDWGPMTLGLRVIGKEGRPKKELERRLGEAACGLLEVLGRFKNYLRRSLEELPEGRPLPAVVARARAAAEAVEGALSPIVAVAGAVAEELVEMGKGWGAAKVVVNNGGDIGAWVGEGMGLVVGLGYPIGRGQVGIVGRLRLGPGRWGVATSGWVGRSHSMGVAEMVTVWGTSAAVADAAATVVCSATSVHSPAVRTAPAAALEPESDLGEREVVVSVGRLEAPERFKALGLGMGRLKALVEQGVVEGGVVVVQGEVGVCDPKGRLAWSRDLPQAQAGYITGCWKSEQRGGTSHGKQQ